MVVATPKVEATLTKLLGELGIRAEPHGAIGVDRALREGGQSFAFLEADAFGGDTEAVIGRLTRRGLLAGVSLVVIGDAAPDNVQSLRAGFLCRASLLEIMERSAASTTD